MSDPENHKTKVEHYVPHLTSWFWEESGLKPESYDVFIETGTYRGFVIDYFKNRYSEIHSIELSKRWYDFCISKFSGYANIHLHHGNSSEILPRILSKVNKPAVVFLDAHYSGGSTEKARTDCDSNLIEELTYLRTRDYDDIIIIDDTSFFGKVGGEEPLVNDPEMSVIWPQFAYDWAEVTEEAVLSLIKPNYRAVANNGSRYTLTPREDQLIFFPDGTR